MRGINLVLSSFPPFNLSMQFSITFIPSTIWFLFTDPKLNLIKLVLLLWLSIKNISPGTMITLLLAHSLYSSIQLISLGSSNQRLSPPSGLLKFILYFLKLLIFFKFNSA